MRLFIYSYNTSSGCVMARLRAELQGEWIDTLVSMPTTFVTKGSTLMQLSARSLLQDYENGILAETNLINEVYCTLHYFYNVLYLLIVRLYVLLIVRLPLTTVLFIV